MIVFGLLVVFLGLKLRERGNLRTNPADEIIASLDCSSNVNISSYRTSLSRSSNNNNNNENTNTNHTSDSNCRPSGGQIKLSSLPSNSINDKLTMSSYWSTSANDSSYRSSNASSNNNKPNFETHLSPPLPSVENRLLAFPYDSRTSSSPTEHIGHQSTANGAHKSAQDAPETSPVIALDLAEPIESNFCQDDSKQQQQQQQQRLTPTPSDSALELSKGMNFLMNHRRRQQTQQQRLRRRRLSKKRVCARRIRWTQLTGGLNGAFGRRNNNNNNHKMRLAAIEAALSTVVTVSTLVGTRHTSLHNFESQQHFCCLEHAIQVSYLSVATPLRTGTWPQLCLGAVALGNQPQTRALVHSSLSLRLSSAKLARLI